MHAPPPQAGHEDVIKLLVAADASVTEHRNRKGESALHLAARKCRMGVITLLTQGNWAIRADVKDSAGLRPCDVVDASLRDSNLVRMQRACCKRPAGRKKRL